MIELTDVSKSYRVGAQTIEVLRHVDLHIGQGEFVALLGPSGSGKSTLMNMIGCLDTPSSGTYTLDGQQIAKLSNERMSAIRNHKIGFVFQNFYLLPRMTALRNVEIPMVYAGMATYARRKRAHELLQKVGLDDRVAHRPNELSGGQKQRVAIARALANDPPVLLADEPTGSLDSVTSHQILDLIQEVNNTGTTVVLITHDQEIARFARRIVHIRDGQVESDEVALS